MPAQGWWRGPPSEKEHSGLPNRAEEALDVVIVGGGVIGLACAWRAAQRGLHVRVLERDLPGSAASRVAAGMLAPVGEATWGEEGLLRLALEAHRAWPGFAAELAEAGGTEVGFAPLGALHVALDRDEAEELRRRFELMQELGLDADWLRPAKARELEPGLAPACTAAIHAVHEAAADPRRLVIALTAAAESAGADIVAGEEVVEGLYEGDVLVGVRTNGGHEHRAARTVLASGAWSGGAGWLPAEARPAVRPVKGQIITVKADPSRPLCRRIVATERVYIVPREDGRVVIGASVEEQGFDLRVTAGAVFELLREAYRALPDVAELELVETIAGLRPGSPDNRPFIGAGAIDGLILATGHFRNGVLLAPTTAEAVADLLSGEREPTTAEVASP
jgi:glycine oxidase